MQSDRSRFFESGDVSKGTPAELKTAFDGRLINEINEPKNIVIHQVKYSSHPDLAGTNQTKVFHFSDNRLTLSGTAIGPRNDWRINLGTCNPSR